MKQLETFGEFSIFLTGSRDDAAAFYTAMGPALVDREIRKELGGPITSSDDYLWLLVFNQHGKLAAFSSINVERRAQGIAVFDNAYVYPWHRENGLHRRMFELRLQLLDHAHDIRWVRGLALPSSRAIFEAHGFSIKLKRGEYWTYEKELTHEQPVAAGA
jgi:hypothetical protein